jgi:hypothetical protein
VCVRLQSLVYKLRKVLLNTYFEIKTHIAAATKAFGALTKFWYNQHIDTYSKYLIFQAIP